MPVICIGPVCVPLNLFLPFLLGLLHHYGYFKWVKREWVTYSFWRTKCRRWMGYPEPPPGPAAASPTQEHPPCEVECSGGVCRVKPVSAGAAADGAGDARVRPTAVRAAS